MVDRRNAPLIHKECAKTVDFSEKPLRAICTCLPTSDFVGIQAYSSRYIPPLLPTHSREHLSLSLAVSPHPNPTPLSLTKEFLSSCNVGARMNGVWGRGRGRETLTELHTQILTDSSSYREVHVHNTYLQNPIPDTYMRYNYFKYKTSRLTDESGSCVYLA